MMDEQLRALLGQIDAGPIDEDEDNIDDLDIDLDDLFGEKKRHQEVMMGFAGFNQLAAQQTAALAGVAQVIEAMVRMVQELTAHQAEATAALREATAAIMAPKQGTVVRDKDGKVVGTMTKVRLN